MITEGKVAFANLTETEVYNGKDTGKYTLVLSLDDEQADKLENLGVKLREYQGTAQRKFSTKYDSFEVLDAEGEKLSPSHVRWGSVVRVQWKDGQPSPSNGTPTYLQKIRVLEEASFEGDDDEDF